MVPSLTRRTFVSGAAALALLPRAARATTGLPPFTTPEAARLVYDLSWIGIPVGRHMIVLEPQADGGDFTVTNRVAITIDLLFIRVIRFEHESVETWRGGLLAAFRSATEDDGELFDVSGEATADGFALSGSEGAFLAPADVMSSNDVWVPPVPGRRPIVNAKTGEVVELHVAKPEPESVRRRGELITAQRFDIESAVAVGSLFYEGELFVSGWFTRKGRTVDYRLA